MDTKIVRTILVAGGAGYIGSHTVVELLSQGMNVIVVDNLSNSSAESLVRAAKVTGKTPVFIQGSVLDSHLLDEVFTNHNVDAVIHFAGFKAVGESVSQPIEYYLNNVTGTLELCLAMAKAGVYRLIFSSSATVYGIAGKAPLSETHSTTEPTSPYGWSKLMVEQVLNDICHSSERWSIASLRYFNPVGAHNSGTMGEDPTGTPNNLMPYISQVAAGQLSVLSIFGDDYETPDGTGIRDYIHVMDLAKGHLAALDYVFSHSGNHVWNLGTGIGYSVKSIVTAFENVVGCNIPVRIAARRPGDIAECWANVDKTFRELGWKAELGLEDMVRDTWRWQSANPHGYKVQS